MKKFSFSAVVSVLLFSMLLSGCGAVSSIADTWIKHRDIRYGQYYEQMWEEILTALDSGDKEAFKELFCDDTASLSDFDAKVDEFFSFYQGKSSQYLCTGGLEMGMSSEYVEKNYEVVTSQASYSISFCYRSQDPDFEDQSENWGKISGQTGLNSILILSQDLADAVEFTQWPPENGIFIYYTAEDCR